MSEEIQETAATQEPIDHRMPAKNRKILLAIVVVVLALAGFIGNKAGVFSPSIGTSLDDPLTQQMIALGGQGLVVSCPPNAKFHAGGTIVCDVIGTNSNSIMPHLKWVDVIVSTGGQYRVMPVNGY